ncbi:MAG: hypothetical protein AVDCRST_MAG07-234 [uncultured Frankineae bacterium]|uniref:Uncharacterized protein n=1 Tax=uncultured Frankineae bacterium TaxID=437475 RepID=A0A6J4KJI8_9ACTN|nr:MAG: hypothetical protein AVDCRST_MAG07-234 [uncultured Frankineae bacterium]
MTPAGPDLLVQGGDDSPRRGGPGRRALAVGLAAVLLPTGAAATALVLAPGPASRAEPVDPDVLRLSLRPGQDSAPRYGPRRPGVHVVVANDGPADVALLSAQLLPTSWRVEVPDRRRLRAGRSVVVELAPPPGCSAQPPRLLQLRARLLSGRAASATLDVTDATLAYGGRLEDALAAAALTCDRSVPPPSDRRTYPHRS